MKKILFIFAAACSFVACDKVGQDGEKGQEPTQEGKTEWISQIIEYRPAPGQFINQESLGTAQAAAKIIGNNKNMLSLGGFGGSVVFRFEHDVINQTGTDFVIFGNPFETSNEPGIVMVSHDANGNNIADDEWFELLGEQGGTTENYSITWTKPTVTNKAADLSWSDNQGGSGVYVVSGVPHPQSFFPLFIDGDSQTLTYTGRRLSNNGINNNGIWEYRTVGRGYVDNFSEDYSQMIGGLTATRNSNKFDISRAVDSKGNKVNLKRATFIKVYTAIHQQAVPTASEDNGGGQLLSIGECSTEVCGALSLSVSK